VLLTPIQARVLGTLMEKARTVPDSYPMTLNSLIIGCNQKTSRDPVMEISDDDARAALESLKSLSLVFEGSGSRVVRFEHNFLRVAGVESAEAALLGLLMLKGPQTAAELRTGGERWHKFESSTAVEALLEAMQQRGDDGGAAYVVKLPRAHGAREQRWAHLLCGEIDASAILQPVAADAEGLLARVTGLEDQVAKLRARNEALEQSVHSIAAQLGIALA
jgi:uncharacterized protein YceH (UPF0502 family)